MWVHRFKHLNTGAWSLADRMYNNFPAYIIVCTPYVRMNVWFWPTLLRTQNFTCCVPVEMWGCCQLSHTSVAPVVSLQHDHRTEQTHARSPVLGAAAAAALQVHVVTTKFACVAKSVHLHIRTHVELARAIHICICIYNVIRYYPQENYSTYDRIRCIQYTYTVLAYTCSMKHGSIYL
jgi:hypothetical protein